MAGEPAAHTRAMRLSPRCGARTRQGTPCRSPAVAGKARCRMHGGAQGAGAVAGNRNALKHGRWTREAVAERRALRMLMAEARETLERIGEG